MRQLLADLRDGSHLAFGRQARATQLKQEKAVALKLVKAKAYKDIKEHPEKYGLSKCTEKATEVAMQLHPDVMDAERVYLQACDAVGKTDSTVSKLHYDLEILKLEVQLITNDLRDGS